MKIMPKHDDNSAVSSDLCMTFDLCPALQISRLQQLGCILGFLDGIRRRNSEDLDYEASYLIATLRDVAHIDECDSKRLFDIQNNLGERFAMCWSLISDFDRAVALWMNYDHYNNYWPHFGHYNLSLFESIHLASGTAESLVGARPYRIPTTLVHSSTNHAKTDAYAPNGLDADMTAFPDFQRECMELRDLCKIFRYSHFQWIGCILQRRDVYETSDRSVQIFDDRIAIRMLTDTGIEHSLAQALVTKIDWANRFKLVWPIMSHYEKSMALNTDYIGFDNFWPGLDFYNLPLDKVTQIAGTSTSEVIQAHAHASHQAYLKAESIRSKEMYDQLTKDQANQYS